MLTVNRQQSGFSGSNCVHEDLATDHERLLVGQQQTFARTGCSHASWQSGGADNGSHHDVNVLPGRHFNN